MFPVSKSPVPIADRQTMKQNYQKYLHSDGWKARKEKYEESHSKECFVCGTDSNICLHHLTYENLGKEEDEDLIWLCKGHHKEIHTEKGKQVSKPPADKHIEMKNAYVPGQAPVILEEPFKQTDIRSLEKKLSSVEFADEILTYSDMFSGKKRHMGITMEFVAVVGLYWKRNILANRPSGYEAFKTFCKCGYYGKVSKTKIKAALDVLMALRFIKKVKLAISREKATELGIAPMTAVYELVNTEFFSF